MNEQDMSKFYQMVFAEAAKESNAQGNVMGPAAVLMSVGLRLYRTGLNDEDFQKVVDNITAGANDILPYEPANRVDDNESL
jgi:hypothetical protein